MTGEGSPGPSDRLFRFAVQCGWPPDGSAASWRDLALRCEDLGYDSLTISDHLDTQLAPLPALMSAAAATTTLRVGTVVLCNDYRSPVMLAKEAATVDLLTDGRLELGLGAGWMPEDYRRAGIPFRSPGERLARLGEAISVIKGLMAGEPFSFDGLHYVVDDLVGTPLPVQRPHPPIFVGGGGPRLLALAAREADVVGLIPSMGRGRIDEETAAEATLEATRVKVGIVQQAAGERWQHIALQVRLHVVAVTEDRDSLIAAAAPSFGLDAEQASSSPYALCGTIDQMAEDLLARRAELGISSIGVPVEHMDDLAPLVAKLTGS